MAKVELSASGVYSHIISDHLHYFEDGGWGYTNAFDSWEFIRGQENDPWVALVQPPVERLRARYDDRHYLLDKLDPRRRTITRKATPVNSWKRLRNVLNRETLVEDADYPSVQCFNQGLAFLDLNRDSDGWFLQVETFDPHEPFCAPARFREAFRTDYTGKILDWPMYEKVAESPEEIAEIRANYAALVAFCDETFGRLLDHFDRHDLWRDTCLVLTTDHGFLLSEHDWWGKNRMPYYEEISRIPLMIWHPDFAGEAGTRRGALTQTADLMPTFLEMAGIPVPAEVTARSLLPVMADGAPIRDGVILGMFGGPICAADGVHTYFRYPKDLSGRGFHEYTLMPAHMAAHFATEEFEGMELASPFDFTKGAPVMRIQAREWAARPPFQDELGFDDVGTRLYRLPDDPRQERPVSDAALEARMLRIIERELRRHDAPPETYVNYGLEAPEEVRRLKGRRPGLRDGGEALAAPREEVTEEEPTGGTT